MAIENKICINCNKYTVCKWSDTIDKFDEEVAKKPIEVLIEMKECPEYKEVGK